MIRSLMTAALAGFIAPAAQAQQFDGVFDYGFCAPGTEAEMAALRISGAELLFYESVCELSDAAEVSEPEGGVNFTLTCEEFGTTTEREIVLVLTEKGLALHDRELIDNFERCD
jgi:hypothetical protein